MGLRQAWWAFITRLVTLGQNEVRQTGRTNHQLSATQYRYLDAMRALGGLAGQHISRPKVHRLLSTWKAWSRPPGSKLVGYR